MRYQIDPEGKMLLDLNQKIQGQTKKYVYHRKHILLVKKYALLINKRLGYPVSNKKLSYTALSHDLFKERGLDEKKKVIWRGIEIPQNNIRYVRTHLDVLQQFELDDYFNTSLQYHSLAAGIFLHEAFQITDPEILYPVMFHSCPICSIYQTLSERTRTSIDILILADKLSSNHLKIMDGKETRIDLDLIVFGKNGKEFNYQIGLYYARLLAQGKCKEEQGLLATEYYRQRVLTIIPFIPKDSTVQILGRNQLWEKRKSCAFQMQSDNFKV